MLHQVMEPPLQLAHHQPLHLQVVLHQQQQPQVVQLRPQPVRLPPVPIRGERSLARVVPVPLILSRR